MKSRCCEQKLKCFPSGDGYWEDCATGQRFVQFKCSVCGKLYRQNTRMPKNFVPKKGSGKGAWLR